MTKEYDVIIAGSGIAGLGVGGLLAKAGKKVLVLEKKKNVGGRASTFKDKDGVTRSIGQHAMFENVKYDELLDRLGVKANKEYFGDILWNYEGKFWGLADIFAMMPEKAPEDSMKMMEILNGELDLDALDDISAEEYISKYISNELVIGMASIGTAIATTIPKMKQTAASVYVETTKIMMQSMLTWLAADGMQTILEDMAGVIKDNGGTVMTSMTVQNINIEDNRVTGVLASETVHDEVIEGEFEEFVEFKAPIVVCNIPAWDMLNNVIPEAKLPEEFVKKGHNVTERTANLGISALLPKPAYEGTAFYMVNFPSIDHPGSIFMPSNICPKLVPEGKHLFESSIICNYSELKSDQKKKHEMLKGMKKDLQSWFPDWDKDAYWVSSYFHYEEPKRAPRKSGRHRPGNSIPEIEGLYFAGDSYGSRAVPGTECASDSAMLCAKEILGELPE